MTEYEEIKQTTGTVETSCTCSQCKNHCRRVPCVGTPDDIVRLINAGFIHKLAATLWMAGLSSGIPVTQIISPLYNKQKRSCEFFTTDGLCELHTLGLKPTEGKLASHNARIVSNVNDHPGFYVASKWRLPQNKLLIKKLLNVLTRHYIKQPAESKTTYYLPAGIKTTNNETL